jgi:hypothetical protein
MVVQSVYDRFVLHPRLARVGRPKSATLQGNSMQARAFLEVEDKQFVAIDQRARSYLCE